MPVFDFLYRLDELIADLDFFIPAEQPLYLRWIAAPPAEITVEALEAACGTDEDRWFYTAMLLLQKREAGHTEYCLRRLVALHPQRWKDDVRFLMNLGTALAMQQRFAEALPLAERAVHGAPREVSVRRAYIRVLEMAQSPREQILEQVLRALELAPGDEGLMEKKEQFEAELAT